MTAKVPPVLRESHIQKACCDYLELDGWRVLKMEAISDQSLAARIRGKVMKDSILCHLVRSIMSIVESCCRAAGVGEVGMADVLAIRYLARPFLGHGCSLYAEMAQVLWIEYKRPGGKPTLAQRDWHAVERARGALTWIAGVDFPASIEGFIEFYQSSGLARKRIT